MTGQALSWLFLGVALGSLALQALALGRILAGGVRPGDPAAGGLLRTSACRVLAALAYVTLAALSLLDPGHAAVLAVATFTAVQLLWVTNSLADVHLRRRLDRPARHRR